MTNESCLAPKGCHVPFTAFYRPVKALLNLFNFAQPQSYEKVGLKELSWHAFDCSNGENTCVSNAVISLHVVPLILLLKDQVSNLNSRGTSAFYCMYSRRFFRLTVAGHFS